MPKAHRQARRFLARTILALAVLGFAINVIVAWCCAVFVDVDGTSPVVTISTSERETWRVLFWSKAGAERICSQRYYVVRGPTKPQPALVVPAWTHFDQPTSEWETRAAPFESRLADARGWPLPSLWSVTEKALSAHSSVHNGVVILDFTLPFRPIWPSLLVDCAFFAFAGGLLCAPLIIRRFRRHWQYRCLRCGYPIGQSRFCTECGHTLDAQIGPESAAA